MIEAELETVLSRPRYGRPTKTRDVADNVPAGLSGHRHGHRSRSLMGTFGQVQISVPRARLMSADGKTSEWKSKTLPAYQRRTRAADALIAGAYLSGTNTRRVRRALAALFGLRKPELLIVDGGAGLEAALAAIWGDVATQRCTVHKHRNLLANAPERLHDEITADYTDMIYADTPQEVQKRRKAFLRKWRLRHGAVANSLEEAGDRLFTFITLPPSQWKSARTTNAIERLHEEFKRRIKTQTVLPSADTAAMLFWALLASGQIIMRKVDGWQTLSQKPSDQLVDVAADQITSSYRRLRQNNSNHIRDDTVPEFDNHSAPLRYIAQKKLDKTHN